MTPLDKKDLHVHTPYCPHRKTDEPLEIYMRKAESVGLKEIAFTEHGLFVTPLELTQYPCAQHVALDETDNYFRGMNEFRDHYNGPVKIKIGMEVDYIEGYDNEMRQVLNKYGPNIEDGLIGVHNVLLNGKYLAIDYRKYVKMGAEAIGARNLTRLYFNTLIKSIKADYGPYKPTRVAHPDMLATCGRHYPEFGEELELMEEFVATVKEYGYTLELNTAGLVAPEDCDQVLGQSLLPFIKKYDVPVCLGSDAHEPRRVGENFDFPVIRENIDKLRPYWND